MEKMSERTPGTRNAALILREAGLLAMRLNAGLLPMRLNIKFSPVLGFQAMGLLAETLAVVGQACDPRRQNCTV
jgi:hypothetical protein